MIRRWLRKLKQKRCSHHWVEQEVRDAQEFTNLMDKELYDLVKPHRIFKCEKCKSVVNIDSPLTSLFWVTEEEAKGHTFQHIKRLQFIGYERLDKYNHKFKGVIEIEPKRDS